MNWLQELYYRWAPRPAAGTGTTLARMASVAREGHGFVHILHAEYQWRKTRNAYVKEHPKCAACGYDKDLEVHHCKPWHLYPALRYDFENLVTLCSACHFRYGHGQNYKHWNPQIRELCAAIQPYMSDIRAE